MLSFLYLLNALAFALPLCAVALRPGQAPRMVAPLLALPAMVASMLLPQALLLEGALLAAGVLVPALRSGAAGVLGLTLHGLAVLALLDAARRAHRTALQWEGEAPVPASMARTRPQAWADTLLLRAPSRRAVVREAHVPYREVNGRVLRARIYRPRASTGPLPAVVFFHGGGWFSGRPGQSWFYATELAAAGYVVIMPRYRLAPRDPLPAAIEDAKACIAWVRVEAERLGVVPGRIYAMGASAGGHLAAMVALSANVPELQPGFEAADTRVAGAVCYYGALEVLAPVTTHRNALMAAFFEGLIFKATYAENPDLFRRLNPPTWASDAAPPILLMHGAEDELVPVEVSTRLFQALKAAGAPVEMVVVPAAWHAFTIVPSPSAWLGLAETLAFLARQEAALDARRR